MLEDDEEFGKCNKCKAEMNSELLFEYDIKFCPYCGEPLENRED
jgi:rRNA maturation endonuclease Nob1